MKYWTEQNQIIILTDDNLLFGNYSIADIKAFEGQLNNGIIPNQITGIPLNYIRDIVISERTKRIDFQLGKGSIEELKFSTKKLRNTVFDCLKQNLGLITTRPSSTNIWRSFCGTTLFIILFIIAIMTLGKTGQVGGYNPGSKAISHIINWIAETFDNTILFILGILLITWRTIVLTLDLKELKGMTRLSRVN